MAPAFEKPYWEDHWQQAAGCPRGHEVPPNPHLEREVGGLTPATALDAGCGEGAEAIWLAAKGWRVTAADISAEALTRAVGRAAREGGNAHGIQWVEADVSDWEPGERYDLVTTHYAHPAMPQLAFYERLAGWVAPGGTLLIVGHRHEGSGHGDGHGDGGHDPGHHPPEEVSVTAASVTGRLDPVEWRVVTADEPSRTVTDGAGRTVTLADVVVRAVRA